MNQVRKRIKPLDYLTIILLGVPDKRLVEITKTPKNKVIWAF